MINVNKTKIEIQYIRAQKTKLKNKVQSIAGLVFNECFYDLCREYSYGISFNLDPINDHIALRIFNSKTFDTIESIEIYAMGYNSDMGIVYFDKESFDKKIDETMAVLEHIQACVKKYQKLNKQNL